MYLHPEKPKLTVSDVKWTKKGKDHVHALKRRNGSGIRLNKSNLHEVS